MNKSKFNYKKFPPKDNKVFLRVSSERAVFKATGEWNRTKKGYLAIPIKILAGTFVDFDGKEYDRGKGILLSPGFLAEDEDFINALNDGRIIGVVCEKNEKNGKYYFKAWAIINDSDDVDVFMHDEEEKGGKNED